MNRPVAAPFAIFAGAIEWIDDPDPLRLAARHVIDLFLRQDGIGRPLAARKIPFDGSAWFLTALDSRKIGELEADPRVNLAYVNAGNGAYVSIDGRAHVSVDRAQIAALWSDALDALFFPAGKDDPNLAALRVEADTAEAWTSASTAVGRAFDFVKATLTGVRRQTVDWQRAASVAMAQGDSEAGLRV